MIPSVHTPTRVSRILDAAADLIERKGWTPAILQAPNGALDVTGAIVLACGGTFRYDENNNPDDYDPPVKDSWILSDVIFAAEKAATGASTTGSLQGCALMSWNDDAGRTQGDVVQVLRVAAQAVAA